MRRTRRAKPPPMMKLLKGPNTTAKLRAARVITHTRTQTYGPRSVNPEVSVEYRVLVEYRVRVARVGRAAARPP